MSQPRPTYLLSAAEPDATLRGLVAGEEPVRLARAADMRGRAPGVLLLPSALPPEEIVAALREAASAPPESSWLPVLLEPSPDGGEPRLVPLSLGWPTPAAELARWAAGDGGADVMELRHVLTRIARARHDINNPLTSAMAETQLALMDAKVPAVLAGLTTIDEQLKRIRDLVAALRKMRGPDPRRS